MRALIRSEVEVAAPADVVWAYATDWERQKEWIPATRVESDGGVNRVGEQIRGWTGIGRVGVWDPMTITAWEVSGDGSARCEVLHTGPLVRGEAEFSVAPLGAASCRFICWEHLDVPGGVVGAVAWKLAGGGMQQIMDLALRRMAARAEALQPAE